MSNPPAPPPGFALDRPITRKRNGRQTPPAPPEGFTLDQPTGAVVDGDTLRTHGPRDIRLYGVDAPELDQQGWRQDGKPVPIGQDARTSLDTITTPQSVAGAPVGTSYGRIVAPVTDNGIDLGASMVRSGNALAAPDFLDSDPGRRFEYMQAERLARQNRLGVHDTFHQPPAEFRSNPVTAPGRETIARFWDTPTPLAGMRPEAEREYIRLINDFSVAPQQVLNFAKSNGFQFDSAQLEKSRAYAKSTGKAIGIGYEDLPRPLTDAGDGRSGAALRSAANGVGFSMLEEAGAAVDALGGTQGRESVWNSDRRFADIYANNLQQNESITGYDRLTYPNSTLAAEIGGALIIPTGRVRNVADLAKWGTAYGFGSGFGQEGTIPQRLASGIVGAGEGLALTVGGTKVLEAAAPYVTRGWNRLMGKSADGRGLDPHAGATQNDVPSTFSAGRVEPDQTVTPTPDSDNIPAPPQGFKLDAVPMRGSAEPAFTAPTANVQRLDQPISEAQLKAASENVRPSDVLPIDSTEVGSLDEAVAIDEGRYSPHGQLPGEDPMWRDQSMPAEERPFPPVEAYAEWPEGGPDFAGNINLDKLETPQDIKRALAFTDKRVGFDAATRGIVSQAETERLAGELGMTPERLLSRRKGQALNAEEALAARQLLAKSGNELVNAAKRISGMDNPGDEMLADFRQKWMRHVAIQEQVAGATAEAGRALAQFKMAANSRAVRGDVLAAIVRGGGGPERIKEAADILIDAVEEGPGVFNALTDKAAKPKLRDKLTELYINSLLSGPQTHVVNMASNTLTSIAQIPEHIAAASIGKARQAFARQSLDRVIGSEVGARAFGLLQGIKEGASLFARTLKTGEPSDFVSKVEGQDMKAISGLKGELVRIPTRLLSAEDEFFKGIARRMELNGLAVRMARREGLKGEAAKQRIAELVANPTDEMLGQAFDYARYLTFQRKLGPGAAKVAGLTQDWPALKLFLPFVRTPTNLLKFAAERSPAAPLLKGWRADFAAGGARRDLAVARMMVGTGFGMAIYDAAAKGMITGSAPTDPAKSRLMYADGFQPYSIRIGDKWYSYKRLDPFSTTIGVAADLATLPEGMSEREKDDRVTLLVASIMGNLASKTWLSGLSDIIGALTEPDQKADRLIQRLAGSVTVPTGVAQVARTVDPVARETESAGEYIQSRIPGLSDNLLPRRDVWGREIVNEGGVGPDILSPIWQSTAKNDPVNQELLKAGVSIGTPQRRVGSRELSPVEYGAYREEIGKIALPRVRALVASKAWARMDDEGKQDAVSKLMRGARSQARESLFSSGKSDAATPPAGFVADGASGGRNVYADLQREIPGVHFTSGYRDAAYQADMRRRGYHPSDSSGHLDGSSFDLLPPEGKSMGWLKAQVKRYDRTAKMLDEGDHLHVTFPGYYGAPALGGAKSLSNPNAGMPPPPTGFTLDRR